MGVARSVGFVMGAVDATGDLGQIAPERAGEARSVTPVSDAAPAPGPVTTSTSPPQSGAPNATLETDPEPERLAGTAAVAGAGGTAVAGGGASEAAAGGAAGSAGAPSPSFWQSFVSSALDLVGQGTIAMCGRNTCNVGEVCCNASCGTCVARGETCDQAPCSGAPRTPTVVLCGTGQCNDGQICCNPSCGTCVAPGETCSDEPCQ